MWTHTCGIFVRACMWTDVLMFVHVYAVCAGEGNGTPLQYSCLENPMDGGAW